MLHYEGFLGDIEVHLDLPDGDASAALTFYEPRDEKGLKRGYGTKVKRKDLVAFADLLKRIT